MGTTDGNQNRARGDLHRVMRRTFAALALALTVAAVLLAGPAAAHVELEPERAEAGATTTLTFSFHHGLDGTATTALEVKLPDGASVVEVPTVPGWESSVSADGTVVAWTGGRVPDGTEAELPVVVRLPETTGTVLFPAVQTTEAGELAWIAQEEGEGEAARPAPRLELTAPQQPTTTGAASEGTASTLDLPRTALEADQRDDGGGSLAPWFIGSGLAAVAAIAVGGMVLRRRAG